MQAPSHVTSDTSTQTSTTPQHSTPPGAAGTAAVPSSAIGPDADPTTGEQTAAPEVADSPYRLPRDFEGRALRRWYRFPDNSLPIASVLAVEAIAIFAGLALTAALEDTGVPWWVPPLFLGLLALALVVRIGGASVVERLAQQTRRRRALRRATVPDVIKDLELPEAQTAALLADGELLATVLEVRGGGEAVAVGVPRTQPYLPLDVLAESLTQYDIRLHSIDVVTAAHGGNRTAWLTIRYEPGRDFAAVERRGGDAEGAERALITATRRIVQRLGGAGLTVRPLDTAALRAVWDTTIGCPPPEWTVSGQCVTDGRGQLRVGDLRRLDRAGFAHIASDCTAMLRLLGHDRGGQVLWAAGMARHTGLDGAGPEPLPAGACGAAVSAVAARAALVPGAAFDPRVFAVHTGSHDGLAQHSPRLDQAGQLLGFAPDGEPVTLALGGGEIAVLRADTSPHTLMQLCWRAVEAGAYLSVATQRPAMWEPLLRGIGDPSRAAFAGAPTPPGTEARPLVVVDDGIAHPLRGQAACAVATGAVGQSYGPAPHAGAIVDIAERRDLPGATVLSVDGRRIDVGLTRRDVEDRVFGHVQG